MTSTPNREAALASARGAIERYVEHVNSVAPESTTNTYHEDFICSLTQEIGNGLEALLFNEHHFPWSQCGSTVAEISEQELSVVIGAIALSTLACRAVSEGAKPLFDDARGVYPGASSFAATVGGFIDAHVFTIDGKLSNIWAVTLELVTDLLRTSGQFRNQLHEDVLAMAAASERGACDYAEKGKYYRDVGQQYVSGLSRLAEDAEAQQHNPSGCVVAIIALVAALYWWFR